MLLFAVIHITGGAPPARAAAQDYLMATWNMQRKSEVWVNAGNLARENAVVALQEVPLSPPAQAQRVNNPALPANIEQYDWTVSRGVERHLYILRTINLSIGIITSFVPSEIVELPAALNGWRSGLAVTNAADSMLFASIHAASGSGFDVSDLLAEASRTAGSRNLANWAVLGDFNRAPDTITVPAGARVHSQVARPGAPIVGTQLSGNELDYMVSNVQTPDNRWDARVGLNYASDHYQVTFGRMAAAAQPVAVKFRNTQSATAKVLEMYSLYPSTSANVTQSTWRHSLDQVWQTQRSVSLAGRVYSQLKGMNGGKCLDTELPSFLGISQLVLRDCEPLPGNGQIWTYDATQGRLENAEGMAVENPSDNTVEGQTMTVKSPSPSSVLLPSNPANISQEIIDLGTWSSGGIRPGRSSIVLVDTVTNRRLTENVDIVSDPPFPMIVDFWVSEENGNNYPDSQQLWRTAESGTPGSFHLINGSGRCLSIIRSDQLSTGYCSPNNTTMNWEYDSTDGHGGRLVNATTRTVVGGLTDHGLHVSATFQTRFALVDYGMLPEEGPVAHASADSMNQATGFLRERMDTFATSGPRVPQSYTGGFFAPGAQFGATGFQSSFSYDNAVTIAALLKKGTASDFSHAKDLGDTLLYAQDHDPVNDGRIRTSYMPDPFITTLGRDYPVGTPYISGWSVYTGNMAWAGMAFAHLYKATGDSKYLDGALRAGNWIQTNAADTRGIGGYTGGLAGGADDGSGLTPRTWKATEHNIDVGAFFAMLNQLTGDQAWKSRSDNAFAFVKSMLSADQNHLWAGTGLDGVTVNEEAVPEDVQTWSYQATLDPAYSRTMDWVAGRMAATDNGFTGVSFSVVDTSGVWFEGTAHLLAAYQTRRAPGDTDKAAALISTLQKAQASAPNTNGAGIVAASHDGLNTGQGDLYYASVHTGATAWYVLGALGGNPFRL